MEEVGAFLNGTLDYSKIEGKKAQLFVLFCHEFLAFQVELGH